ncbi:porin [Komagataeibacter rhaeticus]|nr:porin [Komagataeibacter rhaeticus]
MRLNIHKQVEIGAIWDFGPAPGGPMRLFEGQVSYVGLRHFVFTAGIFKPSFGLESMQAQGDTVFIERSSISTLTRNLATGIERQAVQAEAYGKRYHFALSATAGTAGPGETATSAPWPSALSACRCARAPCCSIWDSRGMGLPPGFRTQRRPALSLSDNPEINPGTVSKYLDTGKILSDSGGAFGVEAAVSWKRLLFQGEAYDILLNSHLHNDSEQLRFHGWVRTAWLHHQWKAAGMEGTHGSIFLAVMRQETERAV